MATLPVKFFSSTDAGAPQLTNDWGCMTTLLDACLVNGYALTALTGITRTGTTATAITATNHPFSVNQVVAIGGADQAAYNGEVCITAAAANSFDFEVAGSPATPATGASLQAKVAPLGWETLFSGTNKRAYRSTDLASARPVLRVHDGLDPLCTTTWGKYARVTMSEGMSGIDTFTGTRAPYDPALPNQNELARESGGLVYPGWAVWAYAAGSMPGTPPTSGSRYWSLVGDGRTFYIMLSPTANTTWGRVTCGFGDIVSRRPNDAYGSFLLSMPIKNTPSNTPWGPWQGTHWLGRSCLRTDQYAGMFLLRPHHGLGGSALGATGFHSPKQGDCFSGGIDTPFAWPNLADNGLTLANIVVMEGGAYGTDVLRGALPGLYGVLNRHGGVDGDVFTGIAGMPERRIRLVNLTSRYPSDTDVAYRGLIAVDTSGPWR